MKNNPNFLRGILAFAPFLISSALCAQGETNVKWKTNLFENKVFVENKGQFDGKDGLKNSQIKFGYDDLGFEVYFTNKGLTYRMDEWGKSEADQKRLMAELDKEYKTPYEKRTEKEMREEDELKRSDLLRSSVIHMEWVGSNPNVQIVADNKDLQYFNYPGATPSKNIDFCSTYHSITYKNLYQGVDLVYTFPEGKKGTKYALILHPGADVSKIKMKYTGAEKISLDNDGNILINNGFGDITDHAPLTFYDGNKNKVIGSSFQLNGNEVTFNVKDYDHSQTLVIDPWTTNPNFTTTNKAWSVETDAAGDFYIMGGLNPYKLRKYSSAGAVLWTTNVFNGLPGANLSWHTTHATDNSGNSYCCLAYTTGWLQKINNAGVAVVTNTNAATGVGGSFETFYPKFNKAKTNLIAGCNIGQCRIANINQTTCVLNGLAGYTSFGMEVRDIAPSDNGNYYGICIDGGGTQTSKVFGATPAFALTFTVLSGYVNANYGYFTPSIGYGMPGPRNTMAASKCYVYTYNGSILYKRNITTGAYVASVTVGGGVAGSCAGILVDSCENVYVGTTTGISKYNSNLAFVTSANTAGAIFDLEFGVNNEIYAAGLAVAASVTGLKQPCIVGNMTLTPSSAPALCSLPTGSAGVTVLGGIGPYTYTWSTGANTSTITNLGPAVYTVTVQDNSCIPLTQTIAITVTATPGSTASISSSVNVACNSFSTGAATATITGGTGPFTYTWSNNQNTQTATNLGAGSYTVITSDSKGCISSATVTITEPPAITGTITTSNVLCNAGSTGSANINGAGGTGVLNYSWSNGPTTQPNIGIAAGTYSCIITDANGCKKTYTVQITQPTPLTLTINSNTTNVCAGSVINVNSFASGGTGPYTYTWNPGPTSSAYNVTEAVAGNYNYVLNATDANGCPITNNINLTFNAIPVITVNSQTVCLGQKAVLTANGGDTYVWNPGNVQGNTFTTTGTSNMNLTVIGTSLAGGCSSSATAAIVVNPLPVPQISASNNKGCVPLCMTFTAANSVGSLQSCSWEFGDGGFASNVINTDRCFPIAGNYTVRATITDANGCVSSITYSLEAYPIPVADFNFSPLKPILNQDPEVTFTDASYAAVVKKWDWYFMNLPKPHSNLQNPTYIYTEAGTYPIALVVTSDHGCTDTIVKTIVVGEDYGIYVPNVFSPNGDGVNDVFQPKGFGITKYELRLFNRWGEQLMFTNDFAEGWDGMYKGKLSKEDTYIWKINLTNVFGKSHELSGHVILIK